MTSNWSTIKFNGGKRRGADTIALASKGEEIDLRPIYPAGTPVMGTTVGPDLSCQVGADGHKLCDWVWPTDAAYVAEAERFARRRQARGGRV
ncbi:MAG: hypothetical protein K0S99_150 [Thermomicrobiales bacterium]|jgi:hypothetical protein|nr:hypothetical protein [Thermomicrobiales bacterium]